MRSPTGPAGPPGVWDVERPRIEAPLAGVTLPWRSALRWQLTLASVHLARLEMRLLHDAFRRLRQQRIAWIGVQLLAVQAAGWAAWRWLSRLNEREDDVRVLQAMAGAAEWYRLAYRWVRAESVRRDDEEGS